MSILFLSASLGACGVDPAPGEVDELSEATDIIYTGSERIQFENASTANYSRHLTGKVEIAFAASAGMQARLSPTVDRPQQSAIMTLQFFDQYENGQRFVTDEYSLDNREILAEVDLQFPQEMQLKIQGTHSDILVDGELTIFAPDSFDGRGYCAERGPGFSTCNGAESIVCVDGEAIVKQCTTGSCARLADGVASCY